MILNNRGGERTMDECIIQGLIGNKGIAIGAVWVVDNTQQIISPKKIKGSQVKAQFKRFTTARDAFLEELSQLSNNLDSATKEILEAQKHIVSDTEIEKKVKYFIEQCFYNVEYALFETFGEFIEKLKESGSELFLQRIVDLENLRDKLIELSRDKAKNYKIPKGSILIAKEISPTDLVSFYDQGIAALVIEKGGRTSHATIIAQSLNLPCIINAKTAIRSAKNAQTAILDSNTGCLIFNPKRSTLDEYKAKLKEFNRRQKINLKLNEASHTTDGFAFHLRANVEFVQELEQVKKSGAEGIGLLRTEALLYRGAPKRSYKEQTKFYSQILEKSSGVCTIRLFDVGGDKVSILSAEEDNPFLGWRGIRMLLDEKEILETQLKAILKVSGEHVGRIQILIPMITDIHELQKVKATLDKIKKELTVHKIPYDPSIKVGIMVEVPSVALLASHFAKEVDFFSIGTNDLTQYTLAVDRGNERISLMYQHNHPAVWQLIYQTVYAGQKHNIPVSVCGELAGDEMGAAALIGVGVQDLSISPLSIHKIKHLLSSNSRAKFEEFAQIVIKSSVLFEISEAFKALFQTEP